MIAAGGAFDAVFGVFVAAFLVLVVVTLRWAVRRDRVGREAWLRARRDREAERLGPGGTSGPAKNGSSPAGGGPRGRGERPGSDPRHVG